MALQAKERYFGEFNLSGRTLLGDLVLDGGRTNLFIQDPSFFHAQGDDAFHISGVLRNLTRVSLLQCVLPAAAGQSRRGSEHYSFADIFPHFVIYGDRHLRHDQDHVCEISFAVSDAAIIFYDFDSYSTSLSPEMFIDPILKENSRKVGREIKSGETPIISYFTGKRQICLSEVKGIKIQVSNNPYASFGGPSGVKISNHIRISIVFSEPRNFSDSLDTLMQIFLFLEVIAGRRQNVNDIVLSVADKNSCPNKLFVYWCLSPKRKNRDKDRLHPADLLIMAASDKLEFENTLAKWLSLHTRRKSARLRFSNSFSMENYFDVDRLICAANMFEILPEDITGPDVNLSKDLVLAKQKAREIFKALPQSIEKQSILNALDRIGKFSLRHKIRNRANLVSIKLENRLPELELVIGMAVDCRNHFVHGTKAKIDFFSNFFQTVPFLTRTLEFVFATSDLIDCGWDISKWIENGSTLSHPFGEYFHSYHASLDLLKKVMKQGGVEFM